MTTQHFKILAEAIATIEDFGERKRTSQLIGTVCAVANKNFNWFIWYETCLVLWEDFEDDWEDFEDDWDDFEDEYDYKDYDYEDYVYGEDYDYDEAWGNDHQEEKP